MEILNMKIIEPIGIHAKIAASLVNLASQYESNIILQYNNEEANMKSILNILALGINSGENISIIIEGKDEYLASKDIFNYMLDQKISHIVE